MISKKEHEEVLKEFEAIIDMAWNSSKVENGRSILYDTSRQSR